MAIAPQVLASQVDVEAVGEAAPDILVSQLDVMAVAIWPTEFIEASQLDVVALTTAATDISVSQFDVMVVARGRVQDPIIRAFVYWQDNHWFYVLRLPTGYTLIYDLTTQQWLNYGSGTSRLWRPYHGTNWLGSGSLMQTYGSNVVVGDDGNGSLYMLNPNEPTDDDALYGAEVQRTFTREITGQIATRDHRYLRCYGVELMGSIGDNETGLTDVTLSISDDSGHTYEDYGTVSIDPDDYSARVEWLGGLGSFTAPGRLFKITDDGAFARIDWLQMRGPEEEPDE